MATTTEALSRARFRSDRTQRVNESVIREMTRLAMEHKAVNLAQGFPDFPAPEICEECRAGGDCRGHQSIRDYLGREAVSRCDCHEVPAGLYGLDVDPERGNHGMLRLDRRGMMASAAGRHPIRATNW